MNENTDIQKPISIILDELRTNIVYQINSVNLPICLIEPIIRDIYVEIRNISEMQLKKDKEEYFKMIENQNKEGSVSK